VNECRRQISVKRPPDASELMKMIKAGRAASQGHAALSS